MNCILKQIFNGTIDPMAHAVPNDPQYFSLWDKIEQETQALSQKLSAEDASRLASLHDLLCDVYCMDIYEGFAQGFRLGIGLMEEVLCPNE